ncbi:hypothetical protein IIA16_04635 [bacterium]|nr:hypothetical protein [bacterium]
MNELRIGIQREARRLLRMEKVSVVIGYKHGPYPGATAPCFAFRPDDAQKLIFNSFCTVNLAVYLSGVRGQVGIVATPSVVRSIKELEKDGLVDRKKLYIIGVRYPGLLDRAKVPVSMENQDTMTVMDHPEGLLEWAWHDLFAPPIDYDVLIEPRWMFEHETLAKPDLGRTSLDRLDNMTPVQRRAHWVALFGVMTEANDMVNLFPSTYGGGDHLLETGIIRGDFSPEDLFLQHLCWVYQGLGRTSGFDPADLLADVGDVPLSAIRAWASRHFRRRFDYRPGDPAANPLVVAEAIPG